MTRIHWVARQNKLETPEEKDEVNKREVHDLIHAWHTETSPLFILQLD